MANARQAAGEVKGIRWKCIWWEKRESPWDDYFVLDIGMSDSCPSWDLDLSDRWGSFLFQDSFIIQFSSVTQLCLTLCNPMDCSMPGLPVHHQLLNLTQTRPSSQWCHSTISSSVVPFSSCLQSFPASECFPVSQLFSSGGQSIGVEASASIFYSFTIETTASSCIVVVIVLVCAEKFWIY